MDLGGGVQVHQVGTRKSDKSKGPPSPVIPFEQLRKGLD